MLHARVSAGTYANSWNTFCSVATGERLSPTKGVENNDSIPGLKNWFEKLRFLGF